MILVLPSIAFSQKENGSEDSVQTIIKRKFILATMGFEVGRMEDRYQAMDLVMMNDWTQNPVSLDRNLIGFVPTFDKIIEGTRFGASTSWIPFDKKTDDYSTRSEMRLGLVYTVRGTHLSYNLEDTSGAFETVNYATRFKELSVTGAYIWKYNPKFDQRFTLYAGLGLGIGSTFSDKTSVAEHFTTGQVNEIPFSKFNVYKGKSSLFKRGFIPFGIDFALAERFDIGLAATCGMGIQTVYNGESYTIPFNGSLAVKLSYFF